MPQYSHVGVAFLIGALLNNLILRNVVVLFILLLNLAIKAALVTLLDPLAKILTISFATLLTYVATALLPPRRKRFLTYERLIESFMKPGNLFESATAITPPPTAKLPQIDDAFVQQIEKEVLQHGQNPHISRVARLILQEKDQDKRKSQLMVDLEQMCQYIEKLNSWSDTSSSKPASATTAERPPAIANNRRDTDGKRISRQRSASDPLNLANAKLDTIRKSCEYIEVTAYPQNHGVEYTSTCEVPSHHASHLQLIRLALNNVRLRLYQMSDTIPAAARPSADHSGLFSLPRQLARRRPRSATGS
jgi:hypothetical protein